MRINSKIERVFFSWEMKGNDPPEAQERLRKSFQHFLLFHFYYCNSIKFQIIYNCFFSNSKCWILGQSRKVQVRVGAKKTGIHSVFEQDLFCQVCLILSSWKSVALISQFSLWFQIEFRFVFRNWISCRSLTSTWKESAWQQADSISQSQLPS